MRLSFLVLLAWASSAWAQEGSRNIRVVAHVAVEGGTSALAAEQARPYAWLARRHGGIIGLDLSTDTSPSVVFETTDGEVRDITTFKVSDHHYLALATGAPAAMILDITIPTEAQVVASIARDAGYRALFAYRHSSGRALLMAASGGPLEILDLEQVLAGNDTPLLTLDTPEDLPASTMGFDYAFAGFETSGQQDRLYLAGAGGYYVYDITELSGAGKLLTHISSAAVQRGRMIVPMPSGEHVLALAEYRAAPIRIFALNSPRVRTAEGAWMAHWQDEYAAVQVRWPFAFVAGLESGLHVINIFDPGNPYTDAYYRTAPASGGAPLERGRRGISRVDVRNEDGLIVASDLESGFWAFRVEAFYGWHGHDWGLPNMSNAQDWDSGPDRQ